MKHRNNIFKVLQNNKDTILNDFYPANRASIILITYCYYSYEYARRCFIKWAKDGNVLFDINNF